MDKKLSIAFGMEIFYPEINGIVTTTMNLIRNLKRLGHDVIIITPRVYEDSPHEVEGVPVYYIPSIPMRFLVLGPKLYPGLRRVSKVHRLFIKKILKQHHCDIVHITAPWLTTRSMLRVAKKLNIPRVQTCHTNLHDEKYIRYLLPKNASVKLVDFMRTMIWKAMKPYMNLSNVITTPGRKTLTDLSKVFPHKNIQLLPNGVELDSFKKENVKIIERIAPDIHLQKNNYAIYIGRMGTEKSVDVLIKAMKFIKEKYPKFLLLLIGTGPAMDMYKKMAQDLGVLSHVKFLGRVAHEDIITSGILKNARFFTTASVTEVQSMTVIESLCAHTPMVLANHESMTILAKSTALYGTPNDEHSFVKMMSDMIENDTTYNKCREEAVQLSAQFDGMEVAKKFISLYKTLL